MEEAAGLSMLLDGFMLFIDVAYQVLSITCCCVGETPMLLVNPKLGDIQSANNVMSVRGRAEREAYKAIFKTIYHFRLLYKRPFWFPIFGAVRYSYGKEWQLYKVGPRSIQLQL